MVDSVKELLSDPLKGLRRSQGVLCYLFRHVLLWRKVNQFSWNKRLNLYFEKEHNKKNPDKGNLNKALCQDDLTWGSFKKAIDFLNPISAVLKIELTWRSGLTSTYSIVIDPAEDESDPALNTFDTNQSEVFVDQKKPANTLARLFRRIVTSEGIDLTRWQGLFDEYAKNPINGIPQTRREMNTEISALQRSLLDPRMSWNTFRRGILVLNPVQEEYILSLRWTNDPNIDQNSTSEHRVVLRDPFASGKIHDRQ